MFKNTWSSEPVPEIAFSKLELARREFPNVDALLELWTRLTSVDAPANPDCSVYRLKMVSEKLEKYHKQEFK